MTQRIAWSCSAVPWLSEPTFIARFRLGYAMQPRLGNQHERRVNPRGYFVFNLHTRYTAVIKKHWEILT